jgi:Flp pilus assembly protein TadB
MRKESIEKLAREKAEKAAMQEAMATNVVIWFPLIFIAFVMIFGGAPTGLIVLFCTIALVAGIAAAIFTWDGAYKKCYKKYLAELNIFPEEGAKNTKWK